MLQDTDFLKHIFLTET